MISDTGWEQFGQAASAIRFRQQSIHLREKNIVGPTERSKCFSILSSMKGPAFFDEDDVCAGPGTSLQPDRTVQVY